MSQETEKSRKEKLSLPDYPLLGRTVVEASGNELACKLPAALYVVATPIGHLGDITLRALVTLAHADAIACEDTRTSGVLLRVFGIDRPTFSFHDHNEQTRQHDIVRRIKAGEAIALISDAGMPLIADPGFKLVRECCAEGISVVVIPGANAAITAMAGSGLPTDRFFFLGFLPPKTVARQKAIDELRRLDGTLIFYEAPQRLAACLQDLRDQLGNLRHAAVARELTKYYEETRRGTLAELAAYYDEHEARGEIVILVGPSLSTDKDAIDLDALLGDRLKSLSVRDAVAEIVALTGENKKEVYARALAIAAQRDD